MEPDRPQEPAIAFSKEEWSLAEAVMRFIQSGSFEEKRTLLETYPELQTDPAGSLFQRIADTHREAGDAETAESVSYHWVFIRDFGDKGEEYAIVRWLLPGILFDIPPSRAQWEGYFSEVARTEAAFRSNAGLAAVRDCAAQWRDEGATDMAALTESFRTILERNRPV